jgi:NAD(P)H-hydrate epimerase
MRAVTREQARRVDELATRELGLPSIVLMENAGRGAAELIRSRLPDLRGTVVVLAGGGSNGGDGFVVARHLVNGGVAVRVHLCADRARVAGDAATNLAVLERMGVAIEPVADVAAAKSAAARLTDADVVVDALLGTGFRGEVREPTASLIRALAAARRRAVVAIDLPSGLDCDTGAPSAATVRADWTVTFVAPKVGFLAAGARAFTGEVVVASIGTPPSLLERVLAGS